MNYLPGAKQLSSQQISDLLSKVNQEQIDQYFKMRYDRIAGKYQSRIEESKKNAPTLNPMTIAIDSTSIATYSESIGDAAFGHAKQDDFLKQINLPYAQTTKPVMSVMVTSQRAQSMIWRCSQSY